ncbi:hypothetical protein JKF63_04451 [Porcisia hertigi]|uniref:Uncharacterized protein n=1 Tax=Porcisia hertigi TaxID=2761500 RepID=A0A836I4Q7_9TRYP|nr:hypothetical protein JKF63_04451 [Porcisia hertigi]
MSSPPSRQQAFLDQTPRRRHCEVQFPEVAHDVITPAPAPAPAAALTTTTTTRVVARAVDTPPALITPALCATTAQSDRQKCEGEAHKGSSEARCTIGDSGARLSPAAHLVFFQARVLQESDGIGSSLSPAVAGASTAQLAISEERRQELVDGQRQQPQASAFSSSLPSSSIMSNYCSIVRILQLQEQECWRQELRAALKQDTEVWVRSVCEEQRLLQAQLSATQARAAILEKHLQEFRDAGPSAASTSLDPSHLIDNAGQSLTGVSEAPCSNEVTCETSVSHRAKLALGKPSLSEGSFRGAGTNPAADTTVSMSDPRYTRELEAYVHVLEHHTRILHSEKVHLQLRLDRRTGQFATAQKLFQQHYASLLQERSSLELHLRRATEDVERVSGMLKVARAAERAAMRRAEEFQSALEELERRTEAVAAMLHLQAIDEGDDMNSGGSTGAATPISENMVIGSHDNGSFCCTSGYASCPPPSSAFASVLEDSDAERCITTIRGSSMARAASRMASLERHGLLSCRSLRVSSPVCPSLVPGVSLKTEESSAWSPAVAHMADVGLECGSDAERLRHRAASLDSTVPVCAPLSPMRAVAEVMRDGKACGESPEVCVTPQLTSHESHIPSQPLHAPGGAVAFSYPLTPSPIADAMVGVATSTTTSRKPERSRELNFADNSDDVSVHTAFTLSPVCVEGDEVRGCSLSSSTPTMGTRPSVPNPLISTVTSMLTPRRLARERRYVRRRMKAYRAGRIERSASDGLGRYQLLRLRCRLLELELQAKETAYKKEKKGWEAAAHPGEGFTGTMREVEARVEQAAAASEKVKGLLLEMSRLWRNSIALGEDDVSD